MRGRRPGKGTHGPPTPGVAAFVVVAIAGAAVIFIGPGWFDRHRHVERDYRSSSTRVARIEPSFRLAPFTSTRAPFFVMSAQVPSRKLVALLVVTFVVPTVKGTLGQVPVDPDTRPFTSASC